MYDNGEGASTTFGTDDHQPGRFGQHSVRASVGAATAVVALVAVWRFDQFQNHPQASTAGQWWRQVVVEAIIVESLVALVLVAVPSALGARRARMVGVNSRLAAGPVRGVITRLGLQQTCIGVAEGLLVFSVLRLRWWPVALPALLLAAWWAFGRASFSVTRWVRPIRPADSDDRWPALVDEYSPRVVHSWVRPLASFSTSLHATVDRFRATEHIIATDTLDSLSDAEQRAVIAHEVGHLQLRHVPRLRRVALCQRVAAGLLGAAVVVLLGEFGSRDPAGYSAFRYTSIVTIGVSATLLRRWRQQFERDADAYALEATRDPDAFQRMVVSFNRANRTEAASAGGMGACGVLSPTDRLAFADQWRSQHQPHAAAPEA